LRAALAALALGLALLAAPAHAAEFITPPGLNVEGQEAVLREQVTRMARDLVGEALVDVLVHVRYVRTDGTTGQRVKLPGLNHYVTPSAQGQGDIVAGHARVRQIVVMVGPGVPSTEAALVQALREQGRFDPSRGDMVRVVKVGAGASAAPAPGAPAGDSLARDTAQLSQRLRDERARQSEDRTNEELGKMIAQGSLAEAQSTTFLIRARQAYFNGDYDRALDQILQSIAQNPNNPQAYAMLGSLYYAVDWKQLALKYWEKSLTLDPDNREIQELVARLRSSPTF
jgi:hypothetical protein